MITFHVDARAVQHRLNKIMGVNGWHFSFTELEKDQGVHGRLTLIFRDSETGEVAEVTREDVGYSSTTDKSEWYKDAVSDALKRCAVHFGVGHILYALPYFWIDLESKGQRYLSDEQNERIKAWLEEQLTRMSKKTKLEV